MKPMFRASVVGSILFLSTTASATNLWQRDGVGQRPIAPMRNVFPSTRNAPGPFGVSPQARGRSEPAHAPSTPSNAIPEHAYPLPAQARSNVHSDHAPALRAFQQAYRAFQTDHGPVSERSQQLGLAYAKLFAATVPGATAKGVDIPRAISGDARNRLAHAVVGLLSAKDEHEYKIQHGPGMIRREVAANDLEGTMAQLNARASLLGRMVSMSPEEAAAHAASHAANGTLGNAGASGRPTPKYSASEKASFARAVAARLPEGHPEKAAFLEDARQYDQTATAHAQLDANRAAEQAKDNRLANRVFNGAVEAGMRGEGGPFAKAAVAAAGVYNLLKLNGLPYPGP